MSKIVLKLNRALQNQTRFLMDAKNITGQSLHDIKSRIEAHQPFVEYTIFENDHDDVSSKLKRLVLSIPEDEYEALKIYELEPDEDIELADLEVAEITTETLFNILDEFEVEREVQQEFSAREVDS